MSRTLVFSSQVYSVETIKKAAYRFSDVLSVDIVPRPGEIECVLQFLSGSKEEEQAERIAAAFKNEVLDQDLRSIISKETEATRNAVLAFALSKTGLQGSE
ncbi:MAG TPA: His-Xaa-Ser system protein HxsD [Xanthobacteraceae bacterium]|nr:His-Xaa-Ser system protein HxsD [Xanthobacteraceae bacterium]